MKLIFLSLILFFGFLVHANEPNLKINENTTRYKRTSKNIR